MTHRLQILQRAAVGDLTIRDLGNLDKETKLSPSRVQIWLRRYEEKGLESLLRHPHRHPRGQLKDFSTMLWLVTGVEGKQIHDTRSARQWLSLKGCLVSGKKARFWLNIWRLAASGRTELRSKLWAFMQDVSYIGSTASLDSEDVSKAHEQVLRYLEELRKTRGDST